MFTYLLKPFRPRSRSVVIPDDDIKVYVCEACPSEQPDYIEPANWLDGCCPACRLEYEWRWPYDPNCPVGIRIVVDDDRYFWKD